MQKKNILIIFLIILTFATAGFFFIPREIDIPEGEKKIFVTFSSGHLEPDGDTFKPTVEMGNYELPNNEKVRNTIKKIKLYPTTAGLFKKNGHDFKNIEYAMYIYIFGRLSGKDSDKLLMIGITSEGDVTYSNNETDEIMSLGFDGKNKAVKLKKELEELIKNEGVKVEDKSNFLPN